MPFRVELAAQLFDVDTLVHVSLLASFARLCGSAVRTCPRTNCEQTRILQTPPLTGSPTLLNLFHSFMPTCQIALHELEGREAICEHNDRFGEKLREQRKLESGWCKVVWRGRWGGGGVARLWTFCFSVDLVASALSNADAPVAQHEADAPMAQHELKHGFVHT